MKKLILFLFIILCYSCNTSEDNISDSEFLADLNSFHKPLVINTIVCNTNGDVTIVVQNNDSLFIYKGYGIVFQNYYSRYNAGDTIK